MTAAGWYPDPLGEGSLRWFDGDGWTDQLAENGTPTIGVPRAELQEPPQRRSSEETVARPILNRPAVESATIGSPGAVPRGPSDRSSPGRPAPEPELGSNPMERSFPPPIGPPVEDALLHHPLLDVEKASGRTAVTGQAASELSHGEGWWVASDGEWYPPSSPAGPPTPPTGLSAETTAIPAADDVTSGHDTKRSNRLTLGLWLLALAFVVAFFVGDLSGSIPAVLLVGGFGAAVWSAVGSSLQAEQRRSVLVAGSAYLAARLLLVGLDILVLPIPGFVSNIMGLQYYGAGRFGLGWLAPLPSAAVALAAVAIGLGSPAEPSPTLTGRDPARPATTGAAPLATPGQRFGAFVLESVLLVATLFVGYFVWALVVYGKGQSPGKQVLGLRVVDNTTGVAATWGRMFFREIAVKGLIGSLTFGLFTLVGGLIMSGRPDRSAPWDRMADTRVVVDRSGSLVR